VQTTLLTLAMSLSAPALKEKLKGSGDIVGEWIVESIQSTGKVKAPGVAREEMRYIFAENGGLVVMRGERKIGGDARGYTIDAKKSPATLDLIADTTDEESSVTHGIYKIEGNRMTMVIPRGRGTRPTAFEVTQELPGTLYILKRVKPKE